MSNKEELTRLTEFAEKDKEFAEKFTAAVKAKNADEAIRLAAEKGFTLKAEDFAFDEMHEVDKEELEHVAGGICVGTSPTLERIADEAACIIFIMKDFWSQPGEGCSLVGQRK